ncbi:MAG: efflux RND transporter periplasmic adaptor subunit [Candidatus Kapabacteria bacterium]|nr:efflux RND transporter periplasmic adaptor subunit [Candidatus Kapabacteria bacterium]
MATKKRRKGLMLTLLVFVVLAAGSVTWFMIRGKEAPVLVSAEDVGTRTITQTVSAIGKLQPEVQVKISSEASGEIIFLGVHDGDSVKTGQLLARIQPDLVQTQVQQSQAAAESARMSITIAKAEVERSEADLKRVTELYKKQFATREELDRAKATYEGAFGRYQSAQSDHSRTLAALRQTQASASRTTIYAPMSGTVTYLAVERGEKVVGTAQMQGTEMMRISDLSTMSAWVDVDENDVAVVNIGDTANIKVDAFRDRVFRGVVYEIGNSAQTAAAGTQEEVVNFQVRIRLIDRDLKMRPGMSCNVEIETETRENVLAVPIQSVTAKASAIASDVQRGPQVTSRGEAVAKKQADVPASLVWVLNGQTVAAREVETGISDNGYIEILKGLKKGERIVSGPYTAVSKVLSEGSKVQVEGTAERKQRYESMRKGQ